MKKKKSYIRKIEPKNHYCIQCARIYEEYIEATDVVWDESVSKAIPLCREHWQQLKIAEEVIYKFNLN